MVGMECARKMPIGMAISDRQQLPVPNWLPTSIDSHESIRSAHLDECFVCGIFRALRLFSLRKVYSPLRNCANFRRRIRHGPASNGIVAKMYHYSSHCNMNRIRLDWLQHRPPFMLILNAKCKYENNISSIGGGRDNSFIGVT